MGEKASRKGVPGRVPDETRSSAVIRATDFSLTHSEYRIGSGSACRAKPVRAAASEMSPQSDAAPLPCGSAPFETHRGSTSSRCRELLSALRRVSTPYPLSSVVSGAVLPLGDKSRSRCGSPLCCAEGPPGVRATGVTRSYAPHLTETTARPRASHP